MFTCQNNSWFIQNLNWVIPLAVTIVFSLINVVLAMINLKTAKEQRKVQQTELGVSLMQKRLAIYQIEQKILESIINYSKPDQILIEESCRADVEIRYLYGNEVYEHFNRVMKLAEKACEHILPTIPDGLGGYFSENRDYETEEYSKEAMCLMRESIEIYNKYVDFSHVGIRKKRKKK